VSIQRPDDGEDTAANFTRILGQKTIVCIEVKQIAATASLKDIRGQLPYSSRMFIVNVCCPPGKADAPVTCTPKLNLPPAGSAIQTRALVLKTPLVTATTQVAEAVPLVCTGTAQLPTSVSCALLIGRFVVGNVIVP
jgi:hypothetical protein